MSEDKVVIYYSCFDYEIDTEDFYYIEPFRSHVSASLEPSWSSQLEHELELLNIRYQNQSLELCCEVYLQLVSQNSLNGYSDFRDLFISELNLQLIFTQGNPEIFTLDALLNQFFFAASAVQEYPRFISFKLLPSCRSKPDLQPLIIAEEAVTTLSQKICHVLKKVSLPFENFIGPEMTQKISNYLSSISNRALKTQQVTSSFVTNIVELKGNGLKVRVIKPAKGFYDKVLEAWKTCSDIESSTCFLFHLRSRLGADWNEKLVSPALCFYNIAREEWGKSNSIGYNFFLRKLQERLLDLWKYNIIETSKNFQEHMVTKTTI